MKCLCVIALAVGPAAPAAAQEVRSVFRGADPGAVFADGQLWIDPTGDGETLDAWSSFDNKTFAKRGRLLALKDIAWIKTDRARTHYLWAPQMLMINGRTLLYYSVGPQDPTPSRLGVATCTGPAGPCIDSGRPLLTGGKGFEAIDPMVFNDRRSGKTYLYAGGSNGAKLRAFELSPDLMTVATEVTVGQPPLFTEGVFMHERGGVYYLSYSHGRWNTADYSVHYAMAPSPIGPWKYRGPILVSDRKFKGPGHHSFVEDPATGQWYIVYHRWEGESGNGPYTDDRHVVVQPITYDALGQIDQIRMTDH